MAIVEMLYLSSTVAVVGFNDKGLFSTRRLTFWNTDNDIASYEATFATKVLTVRMNQLR